MFPLKPVKVHESRCFSGKAPAHWMELNLDQFNSSHLFLQVRCFPGASSVQFSHSPLDVPWVPFRQLPAPLRSTHLFQVVSEDLTCVSSPDQLRGSEVPNFQFLPCQIPPPPSLTCTLPFCILDVCIKSSVGISVGIWCFEQADNKRDRKQHKHQQQGLLSYSYCGS